MVHPNANGQGCLPGTHQGVQRRGGAERERLPPTAADPADADRSYGGWRNGIPAEPRLLTRVLPRRLGSASVLVVLALCAACGSSRSRPSRRLDRTVITRDEMLQGNYASVYDAVAARRSMWLQPRGPDSFVVPSIVWVYIDGTRAGGV